MTTTSETAAVGLPRLNELAPNFDALTTDGRETLADYGGKWLILFFHPADFTPVCTAEFMAFAKRTDDFAGLDTELLGLSITATMRISRRCGRSKTASASRSLFRPLRIWV